MSETASGPTTGESNPGAAKRVAIVQSNYIPWKGYFDLIDSVDDFVLLDCAQYTVRDWRNRNRIKSKDGTVWLTIPVVVKGRYRQRICDVEIADSAWSERHWNRLVESYRRAECFDQQQEYLEALYRTAPPRWLSDVNRHFLEGLCRVLGVKTRIWQSRDFEAAGLRSERLLDLCRKLRATEYFSGPAARAYLDEGLFLKQGIAVTYFDYDGFPEYPQLYPPFEHQVSVVDTLVHVGEEAPRWVLRRPRHGAPVSSPHCG